MLGKSALYKLLAQLCKPGVLEQPLTFSTVISCVVAPGATVHFLQERKGGK